MTHKAQHIVSISGGKDSTAVACLAMDRAQRRADFTPRFMFADTGNEHDLTLEHIRTIERALGITVETVRADFSGMFADRRDAIARDWAKERREKQHTTECREACADLKHAERVHVRGECSCPTKVWPPVPPDRIATAVACMVPSGNPFLDMRMLHGLFPSKARRFCTDELKLMPMAEVTDKLRLAGVPVVQWIGERADESESRAKKPPLELIRCGFRASEVLFRPIHGWTAQDVFAIAKRHGVPPNPLYLQGMGRVGCMPCIMVRKDELAQIVMRFPEVIDRLERWEQLVGQVSRRGAGVTFMAADKVPGTGDGRAAARKVAQWAMTGRGGRNLDLLMSIEQAELDDEPGRCLSRYRLCE